MLGRRIATASLGLDPEIGEAGGKTVHHLLQLPEADGRSLKDQGRFIGELLRRPLQEIGHADLFIVDRLRHALFVGLQPRFFQVPCLSHSRPPSLLF